MITAIMALVILRMDRTPELTADRLPHRTVRGGYGRPTARKRAGRSDGGQDISANWCPRWAAASAAFARRLSERRSLDGRSGGREHDADRRRGCHALGARLAKTHDALAAVDDERSAGGNADHDAFGPPRAGHGSARTRPAPSPSAPCPRTVTITASEAECAALAARFGIPAVKRLEAQLDALRARGCGSCVSGTTDGWDRAGLCRGGRTVRIHHRRAVSLRFVPVRRPMPDDAEYELSERRTGRHRLHRRHYRPRRSGRTKAWPGHRSLRRRAPSRCGARERRDCRRDTRGPLAKRWRDWRASSQDWRKPATVLQ